MCGRCRDTSVGHKRDREGEREREEERINTHGEGGLMKREVREVKESKYCG